MSDLKIKSQWLTTLLERLGMKPKSDGVEREILKHEKTNSQTNGKNVSSPHDSLNSNEIAAALIRENDRPPVMPTLTKPCDDPSPVEGQRSVNELAYDNDVRRLI